MLLRLLLASLLLLLVLVAGGWGGADLPPDQAIVRHFVSWRRAAPDAAGALVWLTHLGGGPVLLLLMAGTALALARTDRAAALALAATTLGGRLLVDGAKWLVDRPRPALDAHPVYVFSQSFPSGHAGNTMITYGAIALFALPGRWRLPGLAAATALSGMIGATRPMLGVHWPSDVLGGWCLGLLWLLACWSVWERVRRSPA